MRALSRLWPFLILAACDGGGGSSGSAGAGSSGRDDGSCRFTTSISGGLEASLSGDSAVCAYTSRAVSLTEIGGDRVEVSVVDAAAVPSAIEALRSVASGDPAVEDLRVSAPVSGGSTVLVDAIRALDARGVEVSDLVLRRPTLDDVFLALTGHVAEEQAPQPSGKKGRGRRTSGEAA